MSYSFLVHGAPPSPAFLRDRGVAYKPIRIKGVRAWIAWRGRTSRGVLWSEDEGSTRVKLPVCASRDDVSLAQELTAAWAAAQRVPIDVEEDPPGVKWEATTAPAAPPGKPPGKPGQYFSPEQLLAWPKNWHDYQNNSIWAMWSSEASEDADKPFKLFSGPVRTTSVGQRFLARVLKSPSGIGGVFERVLGGKPSIEVRTERFVEALVDAQDPRWATVPLRPLFVADSLVPAKRRPNLLHPSNLLGEPFFDVIVNDAFEETSGAFTVFVPGEVALFPEADYVAFRLSKDEWGCVPFDVFVRELGEWVRPLDESTWVAEPSSQSEWDAASARLKAKVVKHLGHDERFLEAEQELHRQASASQGQSDEENALINTVTALKTAGSLKECLSKADELICTAPDAPVGWYWRSRLFRALGESDAAIEALRKSLELPLFNRSLLAGRYADLAEQLAGKGEKSEALHFLDKALAISPEGWSMRADVESFKASIASSN